MKQYLHCASNQTGMYSSYVSILKVWASQNLTITMLNVGYKSSQTEQGKWDDTEAR